MVCFLSVKIPRTVCPKDAFKLNIFISQSLVSEVNIE